MEGLWATEQLPSRALVTADTYWVEQHLDDQTFTGRVKDTKATQLWLQKKRGQHMLHSRCDAYITFDCAGVLFRLPEAIVTQTSLSVARLADIKTRDNISEYIVPCLLDPCVMDCIYEYWYLFRLPARRERSVIHASSIPIPTITDIPTTTTTTLAALVEIFCAALDLEDDSLLEASLASIRHRVVRGLVEGDEWIDGLVRVYGTDIMADEKRKEGTAVLRRVLLTTALRLRSSVQFPGPLRDAFQGALGNLELSRDWGKAKEWQDRMSI